jgi:hypothetical protein
MFIRGCLQRKWYPMLGLTMISPYLMVNSEVQLSTPMTTTVDDCFPILLNGTTNMKRESTYREGEEKV